MANRFPNITSDEALYADDEELDEIKGLLVYILMKDSPLDTDALYTYIFGEGKRLIWH